MPGNCIKCLVIIDLATCPYISGQPFCFNCYCQTIPSVASSVSMYPVYCSTTTNYPISIVDAKIEAARLLNELAADASKLEKDLEEKIIESTVTSKKRLIDFEED